MGSSSQHYYDASYEIWRNGGNPDRLSWDRSDNDYYDGRTPEYTANRELREMRDARERRMQIEAEEAEYYEMYEQQREHPEPPCPPDPSNDLPF